MSSFAPSISLSAPPSVRDIVGSAVPEPSSFPASPVFSYKDLNAVQQRVIIRLHYRAECHDALTAIAGIGNTAYQRKRGIREILIPPADGKHYPIDWLRALFRLWVELRPDQQRQLRDRAVKFAGGIMDDAASLKANETVVGSQSRANQATEHVDDREARSSLHYRPHRHQMALDVDSDYELDSGPDHASHPRPRVIDDDIDLTDDEIELKEESQPQPPPLPPPQPPLPPASNRQSHKRTSDPPPHVAANSGSVDHGAVNHNHSHNHSSNKRRLLSNDPPSDSSESMLVASGMRTSLTNHITKCNKDRELLRYYQNSIKIQHNNIKRIVDDIAITMVKIDGVQKGLDDSLTSLVYSFDNYERMLLGGVEDDGSVGVGRVVNDVQRVSDEQKE